MTASLDELPIAASQAWSRLRDETRRSLGDDLTALWGYGGTIFPDRSRRLGDLDMFAVVERVPDERTKRKLEQAEAEIAREHGISIGTSGMCLRLTRDAASLRPMRWIQSVATHRGRSTAHTGTPVATSTSPDERLRDWSLHPPGGRSKPRLAVSWNTSSDTSRRAMTIRSRPPTRSVTAAASCTRSRRGMSQSRSGRRHVGTRASAGAVA
jgi:hypothetical protein